MNSSSLAPYFPDLTNRQNEQFALLTPLYESWNQKVNVVSRKDIQHLMEHHVLHSLGVAKIIRFLPGALVFDIGTGGGFPGIPLAIMFPEVEFLLVDSIAKKINVVRDVVNQLQLHNVEIANDRAENITVKADFAVSRAVATLPELMRWTKGKFRKESKHSLANGLLSLKGGDLQEELGALNRPYHLYSLSNYFNEAYFQTKKLVHVPDSGR